MGSRYSVLVMDAGLSATLAVMRALRADGAAVHLAMARGAVGAARYARGCAGLLMHGSLEAPEALATDVLDYARRRRIDVVLPLTDAATATLDRIRSLLDGQVALAIPPPEAIAATMDKGRTLAMARDAPGTFDVPATIEPERPDDVDPNLVASWPVLVKPRDADGARGIQLVARPDELRPVYAAVHRQFPRPLVQSRIDYVPGAKAQLYYLFDRSGVLRARFMQRVLREAASIVGPEGTRRRGGISLLWESAFDADLLERGARLLASANWRGTGFVEVVRDSRDGRHLLLEINPRLSGSIHLCLACGPNLAAGCCRVALGLPVQLADGWPTGRRARRDPFHMISNRAWLPLLDPRNLPPYRLLGEPMAFAAACAGRLRTRFQRPDQP